MMIRTPFSPTLNVCSWAYRYPWAVEICFRGVSPDASSEVSFPGIGLQLRCCFEFSYLQACVNTARVSPIDLGNTLTLQGYEAKGALEVMRKLSEKGISGRPLGNVAYFMASPLTSKEECKRLLDSVLEVLA